MTTSVEFQAKLAEIKLAMEREEWAKAIDALENIGSIPDKFYAVFSNILFFLYVSRNQYQKLQRLSDRLDFTKSKDAISALLLFRDHLLGYPIDLPKSWNLDALEQAVETHAQAGKFDVTELQLCICFLSMLGRPKLLQLLHASFVERGGRLDSEAVEIVIRCYLRNQWFNQARRFLWSNNLNGISFDRFTFLIDHAEKSATDVPESNDKFLTFLRYKFGPNFPLQT